MVRSWAWLGALALALACGGTVSRSEADDGGGTPATGGTSFGGTSFGGTSFGGTSFGGTSFGGAGAGGYTCDQPGNPPSTPGNCDIADPNDACQQCIEAKCCLEQMACQGTAPNNPCWWGGPPGPDGYPQGEIFCIQDCMVVSGDLATCAGQCTSPGCGTISQATNDFAVCLDTNCLTECFSF